jgi:hypothetical protein
MAYTQLIPRHSKGSRVEEFSRGMSHYLLSIPAGKADQYRLAQLDDYAQLQRKDFPHPTPYSLSISARTSSDSIPGTWGFGFWNDPFGMSLGFGGSPFRLPALPNAAWFFGASEENYLSFKTPRAERSEGRSRLDEAQIPYENRASSTGFAHRPGWPVPGTNAQPSAQGGMAANGFLAQTFRSPKFHPLLIPAGLTLPFSRKTTRRLLGKVIGEDGLQLWSPAARDRIQGHTLTGTRAPGLQKVDPTQWHRYQLDWREKRVSFEVDDAIVFETAVSPHGPLGLVIWIDNQYAAFTPEGNIGSGVLENPEPAWLEIKDVDISQG